ncbi:hypothetical protein TWF481_012169 [Arthrobotrys musiformis]|uniref:Uncharacterized protein n=1 Tax=Arthrobotrys musiformis TaxID=47236 RepID=A0AAV9VXR9_9PEZI
MCFSGGRANGEGKEGNRLRKPQYQISGEARDNRLSRRIGGRYDSVNGPGALLRQSRLEDPDDAEYPLSGLGILNSKDDEENAAPDILEGGRLWCLAP